MCDSKNNGAVNIDKPRVSIGMPVYNGEKFICKALDALLSQTFSDFELIISDNASTDNTEAICREYATRDSRIRYVCQEKNQGPLANFQYVLDEAVGEYFMWAAVDDFWEPVCVERWVYWLDTDMDAVLVFSNMRIFSHQSGDVIKSYVCPSIADSKRARLLNRYLNCTPSLIYGLFRKSAHKDLEIEKFDFFDVYWSCAMAVKGKILVDSEYLYHAGIKNNERVPYSLTNDRITYWSYFKKNICLIRKNFDMVDQIILIGVAILFTAKIIKNYGVRLA
jgi:glycosyltransferase involved in cell wall biosynthesis